MKIIFSRHAKRQMKSIGAPDMLVNTTKGRKNAFKTIEGRYLKVTYKAEDRELTVITAMVKGE
ncbi:MAG: hypothetical protein KJ550_00715 [Proteobacteria bacterium]|nr:hypothetical protein [Desulfobacteraceae bacterium]MBU3980725.1 hypothetical protein [Pseudomonadota bacterium]MBU4011971.1 hypothetical protein [Pseudomonadota bacterium]